MKIEEANEIIAEFMDTLTMLACSDTCDGCRAIVSTVCFDHYEPKEKERCGYKYSTVDYSKSLDALIPVWEKLNTFRVNLKTYGPVKSCYVTRYIGRKCDNDTYISDDKTIQEAACIATARAIEVLKENEL